MKNATQISTKNFPFELLFKGKSNIKKGKITNFNFADFFGVNELLIKKVKSENTKTANESLNIKFTSVKPNLKPELLSKDKSELILENKVDKRENIKNLTSENSSKTKKIKSANSHVNQLINNLIEKNTIGLVSESGKNNKIQSDTSKNNIIKSEIISMKQSKDTNLSKVNVQSEKINSFVLNNSKETANFTNKKIVHAETISPKFKNTNKKKNVDENGKNQYLKVTELPKIKAESFKNSQEVNSLENDIKHQIKKSENIIATKENSKNKNEKFSKEVKQSLKFNSDALSNVASKTKFETINDKNANITNKIDTENTSKSNIYTSKDDIKQNQKSIPEISVQNQIKENKISPTFERSAEDSSFTIAKNDISKKFNSKGYEKEKQNKSQDDSSNSPKVLLKEKVDENENLDKISGELSVFKTKSTDSSNKLISNKVSEENNETPVKNDVKNTESKKLNNIQPIKDQPIVLNKTDINSFNVEKTDQLKIEQNPISNTSPIINPSANSIVNSFFSTTPSVVSQIIQYSEIAKNIKPNVSKFNIDLGQNEKLEIQFTKQGESHSAKIFVGSETSLHSIEKLIPEIKIQLENKGINFIDLDVEMQNNTNENKRNENSQQVNKNHKYNTINNESTDQIISQISNIRDFGYNTIEILA